MGFSHLNKLDTEGWKTRDHKVHKGPHLKIHTEKQ